MTINQDDSLSATTIAQTSYCENQVYLDHKYGKQKTKVSTVRMEKGSKEHVRHHKNVQKYSQNKTKDSRCFVASEIYGENAFQTNQLRTFRDTYLLSSIAGRSFVRFYYFVSPALIKPIRKIPILGAFLKKLINISLRGINKWI